MKSSYAKTMTSFPNTRAFICLNNSNSNDLDTFCIFIKQSICMFSTDMETPCSQGLVTLYFSCVAFTHLFTVGHHWSGQWKADRKKKWSIQLKLRTSYFL